MINFNIAFGVLAILGAAINIYVGTLPDNEGIYVNTNIFIAVTLAILAFSMVTTGFAKLNVLIDNTLLAKSHIYVAVSFYIFAALAITYLYNTLLA